MSVEIIDCEQNTEDWHRARLGIPTASEFATVLAKGRGDSDSKTRKAYLYKLAGEIITGEPTEGYSNTHMERGHIMEPEARDYYSFMANADIHRVGFIRNGDKGCSPDSLVGSDGMLEVKTKLPHLLVDILLKDEFPAEHKAQCQGALWVAEREWIDIVVYWPKMPIFIKRAYRDEAYIASLASAVSTFNAELAEVVSRLKRIGEVDGRVAA